MIVKTNVLMKHQDMSVKMKTDICFVPEVQVGTCKFGIKIVRSQVCEIKHAKEFINGKRYLVATAINMHLYDTISCCIDSRFAGNLSWERYEH